MDLVNLYGYHAKPRQPSTSTGLPRAPAALAGPDQPGQPPQRKVSGAGLFAVAPEGGNLVAQGLNPSRITATNGHGQGKFQLFQLVITLAAPQGIPSSHGRRRMEGGRATIARTGEWNRAVGGGTGGGTGESHS